MACALIAGACCSIAAAQDDGGDAVRNAHDAAVLEARSAIDAILPELERLFADGEQRHGELRAQRVRGEEPDRDADRAPSWLRTPTGAASVERVVVAARGGSERVAELAAASAALLAEAPDAWRVHATAVVPHLVARAMAQPQEPAADIAGDLFAQILDPESFADVWDTWFQQHPLVLRWRTAQADLASLMAPPESPEPDVPPETPVPEPDEPAQPAQPAKPPGPPDAPEPAAAEESVLVGLERGRFEVGPWDGWTMDLSERDQRRVKVSVKVLHVDRHEVTCAQYAAFLAARPEADRVALLPSGWTLGEAGEPLFPEGRGLHPVTGVTFLQASEYAAAAGKRLPTEDEWERVAAAGDEERLYPWGASAEGVLFACKEALTDGPTPVLEFPADVTPDGVFGLAGNVKEMVATHPDRKAVKGRVGEDEKVVIRGGGYRTRAVECTTRWRWVIDAGRGEPDVGFRCVMDDAEFRRRR